MATCIEAKVRVRRFAQVEGTFGQPLYVLSCFFPEVRSRATHQEFPKRFTSPCQIKQVHRLQVRQYLCIVMSGVSSDASNTSQFFAWQLPQRQHREAFVGVVLDPLFSRRGVENNTTLWQYSKDKEWEREKEISLAREVPRVAQAFSSVCLCSRLFCLDLLFYGIVEFSRYRNDRISLMM